MSFSNGDVKMYHSGFGGPDLFRGANTGGEISGIAVLHNRKYNFVDDISRPILGTDPVQGDWIVYTCGFARNTSSFAILNNFKIWISQDIQTSNIEVALAIDTNGKNQDAHVVADRLTAPAGQVFQIAKTELTSLNMGTMMPGDYRGFWVRLKGKKGTQQLKAASFMIRFTFDKPADNPESGGGTAGFDIMYIVATHEVEVKLDGNTTFAGQICDIGSNLIGQKPAKLLMQLKKVGSPTGNAQFKIKHQNSSISHPDVYVFPTPVDVSTLSTSAFLEFTAEDPTQARALSAKDMFGLEYTNGDASNYVIVGYVDIAESIPASWRYTIDSAGNGTANTAQELWAALYRVGTGSGGAAAPPSGDTTPPTITTKDPLPNASAISITKTIGILFSEALKSSTITDASVNLKQGATPVPVALSISSDLTTVFLDPTSNLTNNTVYTVTVTNAVQDFNGNPLTSGESWQFTTAAVPTTVLYDHLSHASSWQGAGDDQHSGRGLRQMDSSTSTDSLWHDVPKEVTVSLRRNGTLPNTDVYCRIRNYNNESVVLATIGQIPASSITTSSSGADYIFTKSPPSTYTMQEDDCIFIEYFDGGSSNNIEIEMDGSADWSHGNEINMDENYNMANVPSRDAAMLIKG